MMNWFGIAAVAAADNSMRTALVVGEKRYDAQAALASAGLSLQLPEGGLAALLAQWPARGDETMAALATAARAIEQTGGAGLPALNGPLGIPWQPGRIFATASNFYEHAAEMGTKLAARSESSPYVFMKADSSVTPTGSAVVMPAGTQKLDWEVELGVVIGKGGRNIPVQSAHEHIAGYTVVNDISARDLNRRTDYPFTHDWFRGKSFDTFCPMGPWFVPRQCIGDPQKLRLQLSVNGQMMQDATAEEMIFNIAEQIAYLSGILTLRGGDLIATGTPTGVGMGRGIYLKAGDVMVATVEQIGSIENRVVAQDAD